jgi:hypothetical protein
MRMETVYDDSSSHFWQLFQKRIKSHNTLCVQNIKPGVIQSKHRALNRVNESRVRSVSSEFRGERWNKYTLRSTTDHPETAVRCYGV